MKKQILSKIYNPSKVEGRVYKFWEKTGFFNPDKLPKRYQLKPKSYCIVIPPPNITGELHLGHALNATVQDILIRQKRMQGFKTLWLPGTDHAAIATQNVIEKELKKEGKTRFDLGKEKFFQRFRQWVAKYGNIILHQFKSLGCSLDWSRTRFTMDKKYTKAVEVAFLHFYKKGWIYKGERPVNWCKRCGTGLSDLELKYKDEKGKLWYIKYKIKNKKSKIPEGEPSAPYGAGKNQNFITVATTRPETMLGDTAVAVNPKDKRYKNLVGKKAILPLVNREIPIIADFLVDPKFGTGAVKITPAHDLADYEISIRNQLPMIKVIDEKGFITSNAPSPYRGLSLIEARGKVVKDLENLSLIAKIKDVPHRIPICYRCNTIIEILPSPQWFLKMAELAKQAIGAVKKKEVKFYPKRFEKIYFDWLNNIRDWPISRQIWIGHKVPLKGEEDVLDTWFSSALWPFAVFGWPRTRTSSVRGKPKKISDFDRFYPTDVLSTARDIINLWVARMVFSALELTKKIPFRKVYIHPTVLTLEGKRMSKSLGIGVDPLQLIEKYGADATRFGICWQITGVQDIRFSEDHIIAGKKFCNKIWNATRFLLMQKPTRIDVDLQRGFRRIKNLTPADRKILKKIDETIKSVNQDLENFRFGQALQRIYHFFWHDFCDKYIEIAKSQITNGARESGRAAGGLTFKPQTEKEKTKKVLLYVLLNSLKLFHPFLPFITEEIYQKLSLKNKKKSLMIENWPHSF